MKLWSFEGTTEEFNTVFEALIGKSVQHEDVQASEHVVSAHSWDRFATVEQAIEILTRRELSTNMTKVLKALYEAGSGRLTSDDLKEVSGLNPDQFRGLMGAFGRRTKYTLKQGERILDDHWAGALKQYTWTLPETTREAMRQLKLV
jgi:hypothetical protein